MPRRRTRGYEDAEEEEKLAKGTRKHPQNYRAKKVVVYINGQEMIPGKKMSVSASTYPTFEAFLDALSSELGLMWPVRVLFRVGGKRVRSLEDLEENELLVAGNGRYQKAPYGEREKSVAAWAQTGKANKPIWDEESQPEKGRVGGRKGRGAGGSMDDGYESEPNSSPKEKGRGDKREKEMRRSKSMNPTKKKSRRHRRDQSEDEEEDSDGGREKRSPERQERGSRRYKKERESYR